MNRLLSRDLRPYLSPILFISLFLSGVFHEYFKSSSVLAQVHEISLSNIFVASTKQVTIKQFQGKIISLAISPNGQTLLVGTGNNQVSGINLRTKQVIFSRSYPLNDFASLVISKDGKIFAIASQENVIVSRLSDGKTIHTLKGHNGEVNDVAISPDGNFLVSVSSSDRSIRVWDLLRSGELLKTIKNQVGIPVSVDFTPDGAMFITGGIEQDRTFKFWDVTSLKLLKTSPQQPGFINSITITDNGSKLVAAVRNLVRSWDLKTGKQLMSVKGPNLEINMIAVSPDNRTVATANKEGTIMLFDLVTRRQLKTLSGHKGWVLSLAFSHDGKYLYSGAEDKTLKVWQIKP